MARIFLKNPTSPDDVEETNYDPYMGSNYYDYDPTDLGWDI